MNYRETASYKAAINILHNANASKALNERYPYQDDTLPFCIWTDIYKYFIDNTVNCHWHLNFEFGVLLEGSVEYYINDTHIRLEKGDVCFVNSNILHMSKQAVNSEDAVMYTLRLSTSLLSVNINSTIYARYIQPLLNSRIEGFKILEENPIGRDIKAFLMNVYELDPSTFGYELECTRYLNQLWLATLNYIEDNKKDLFYHTGNMLHSERMKEILSYIHKNFNKKITIAGMAKHMSISRVECFRCFKHYMNKTPVDYINEYRLQQITKLLRETEKSIADISSACGFENTSYFNKIFKNAYSMTPLQYRKAQIWTDNTILNINNYDYEYWKDSGNGTMIITANANNGSFICEWHNINNIVFRSGKKFINYDKTHKQLGNISLKFDAAYRSNGISYLCVYGWTVDPLIEWYIVECYAEHNPASNFMHLGTHDTDGGTYNLYYRHRENKQSILGVRDFGQYWSIRTAGRLSGTVNVSAHLSAWENAGLMLGNLAEIALNIEGWQSSGNATVNTNILTFKPFRNTKAINNRPEEE